MKPKGYYNEECFVCRIEINHYKKISNCIEWVDVNTDDQYLNEISKTKNEILRRIHIKNDDKILIGVDAFIFVWDKIPKYRILSKLIRLPIFYQLAFIIYEILAFLLFIKNYKQFKK